MAQPLNASCKTQILVLIYENLRLSFPLYSNIVNLVTGKKKRCSTSEEKLARVKSAIFCSTCNWSMNKCHVFFVVLAKVDYILLVVRINCVNVFDCSYL